jgi:hypothetical protein
VPAAARFQLIGCALLATLAVCGCGGGDSDSTGPTFTSQEDGRFHLSGPQRGQKGGNDAEPSAKSERRFPAGDLCQSQLGSFVGSMDGLRRRLAVGVTYDQYVAEVRGIRSTYGKIPIERLQIDCLTTVATPGEKAFNRYIEAANDWGECVSEAGCGSEEIEPVLQRRWRIASHFLTDAKDALTASGA